MARTYSQISTRGAALSPGDHLRVEIERLGLDQVAVSKAAGVSRQSINNIINGRQTISRSMAAKIGRLTGHSSDYWLQQSFSSSGMGKINAPLVGNGVLAADQIARVVEAGVFGVEPFAAENVKAASISLTLGGRIITVGGRKISVDGGKNFSLKPGRSANVSTKERIEVPRHYIGRVSTIYTLGAIGVITSAGFQLGPGFAGQIQFWIFNAGGSPFRLRAGEPIVSLEIIRVGSAPTDLA